MCNAWREFPKYIGLPKTALTPDNVSCARIHLDQMHLAPCPKLDLCTMHSTLAHNTPYRAVGSFILPHATCPNNNLDASYRALVRDS